MNNFGRALILAGVLSAAYIPASAGQKLDSPKKEEQKQNIGSLIQEIKQAYSEKLKNIDMKPLADILKNKLKAEPDKMKKIIYHDKDYAVLGKMKLEGNKIRIDISVRSGPETSSLEVLDKGGLAQFDSGDSITWTYGGIKTEWKLTKEGHSSDFAGDIALKAAYLFAADKWLTPEENKSLKPMYYDLAVLLESGLSKYSPRCCMFFFNLRAIK